MTMLNVLGVARLSDQAGFVDMTAALQLSSPHLRQVSELCDFVISERISNAGSQHSRLTLTTGSIVSVVWELPA